MARTLDPDVDRAIHEAVLGLLAVKGLSGVTIEDVAARAGVARTTVYRRYDSVWEMVEAAVDDLLSLPAPEVTAGGREAWRQLVESLRQALFESGVGLRLLSALIVAEDDHPELLKMWRARVVAPRVEMISQVFGWPAEEARGVAQLALGGLLGAYLAKAPVSEAEAAELADQLWDHFGH